MNTHNHKQKQASDMSILWHNINFTITFSSTNFDVSLQVSIPASDKRARINVDDATNDVSPFLPRLAAKLSFNAGFHLCSGNWSANLH